MAKYMLAVFLIALSGCHRQEAPQTAFTRDYAILRPQIDECEKYSRAQDMTRLSRCIERIGPFANQTIREANDGDVDGKQNITANEVSAELNVLQMKVRVSPAK